MLLATICLDAPPPPLMMSLLSVKSHIQTEQQVSLFVGCNDTNVSVLSSWKWHVIVKGCGGGQTEGCFTKCWSHIVLCFIPECGTLWRIITATWWPWTGRRRTLAACTCPSSTSPNTRYIWAANHTAVSAVFWPCWSGFTRPLFLFKQKLDNQSLDLSDDEELREQMDMHSIIVSSISDEPLFTAEQVQQGVTGVSLHRDSL